MSLTVTVPSALLQGFFRKGNVLLEMGQQTEALIHFHRCLKLQADFAPAKTQIRKVCSSSFVTRALHLPPFVIFTPKTSLNKLRPALATTKLSVDASVTEMAVIRFAKLCVVKF